MDNKIASLLSICQKSGNLVSGELSCEKTLQKKKAKLVIIAEDASDNTKKKFINKSFFYNVPSYIFGTKDEISRFIGKNNRAVVIITEKNLSLKIKDLIEPAYIAE